jgi:hypothetical protein
MLERDAVVELDDNRLPSPPAGNPVAGAEPPPPDPGVRDALERLPTEHQIVTQFLAAIRSACEEQGLDFRSVLLTSDQETLHEIAEATDTLYAAHEGITADDLAHVLNAQFQLQLRQQPGKGGYIPLKKIPRLKEKPGQVTFAILSRGETAPRHKHMSPSHKPGLPGEKS